MIKEAYFEDVLQFGNLYLDKVFNDFEGENIIFTCRDEKGCIFLAVCYEFRFKLEWILCKIDEISLIDLIRKKIDLHTIFKVSDKLINIVTDFDGDHISEVNYDEFNISYLPTPGIFLKPNLDLTYYFLELYKRNVESESTCTTYFFDLKLNPGYIETLYSIGATALKFEYDINIKFKNEDECITINLLDAA